MLITKEITLKWTVYNRDIYTNKGYVFTSYKDKITMPITDLSRTSQIKVTIKCDYCGDIITKRYVDHCISNDKTKDKRDCCIKCRKDKSRSALKLSYEFIKLEFSKYGYTLISESYQDSTSQIIYSCPKHGMQSITYNSFQQGRRCPQCSASKGEQRIQEYLDYHKIIYANEYTFKDLVHERPLRFDFCIFGNDGKTIIQLIEYQGIQHYEPVDFSGKNRERAEEQFKINQHRDKLKVDYCKLHNIPLLIIKYDEFSCLDDILSEATKDFAG